MDQLTLIGDEHESIPTLLIMDPDLNSNDKILWQTLRLSIQRGRSAASMPNQAELADMMHVTKRTIISSIQSLRLTRWLTIQHSFDDNGFQLRNVYGIHSRPCSISDAITADRQYADFASQLSDNKVDRVRLLAKGVLRDMTQHPFNNPTRILAEADEYQIAMGTYHPLGEHQSKNSTHANVSIFGRAPINADPESKLSTGGEKISPPYFSPKLPKNGLNHGGEKISPPVTSTSSSTSFNNTTTSKSRVELNSEIDLNNEWLKLSKPELQTLQTFLTSIPMTERQSFWDEFTVLVLEKSKSPKPVGNKPAYFRGMVQKYLLGEFNFTGATERMSQRRSTRDAVEAANKQSELKVENTKAEEQYRELPETRPSDHLQQIRRATNLKH